MIDRRVFVLSSGAWLAPMAARPQQSGTAQRVARIGALHNLSPSDPQSAASYRAALVEFKRLGWEEGRNLVIERRYAMNDPQKYRVHAEELVAAKVDLIIAPSDAAVAAAYRATQSIPIVMLGSAAVEPGYAKSLARPGGNVTGVVFQALDFTGKEFGLLKAMRPDLKKIGLPVALGSTPLGDAWFRGWQNAAGREGATVVPLPAIFGVADIEPMLAAAKREDVQLLVVGMKHFLNGAGWQQIQAWAIENKVLTNAGTWAGGEVTLAYGPDVTDFNRIIVGQVDRILRGAKPADLPIEQPTRFELIVNEKLAKAVGLTVPPSVLLQATEVIR